MVIGVYYLPPKYTFGYISDVKYVKWKKNSDLSSLGHNNKFDVSHAQF